METSPSRTQHDPLCVQNTYAEQYRIPAGMCRECKVIALTEQRTLARLRGEA